MIDLSEFKFDDAFLRATEEDTIEIYLSGPKEYLENKYEDVIATELVFVIKDYKDVEKAYVDNAAIMPTCYDEEANYYADFDWVPLNKDGYYTKEVALYVRKLAKIGGCKYID